MNWCKRNIKNIIDNRYIKILSNVALGLIGIWVSFILLLASFSVGTAEYVGLHYNQLVVGGVLAIYLFLALIAPVLCIIVKKRLFTIGWMILSFVFWKWSQTIPDIHKIEIYNYCADVNCDPVECLKTNCW